MKKAEQGDLEDVKYTLPDGKVLELGSERFRYEMRIIILA